MFLATRFGLLNRMENPSLISHQFIPLSSFPLPAAAAEYIGIFLTYMVYGGDQLCKNSDRLSSDSGHLFL